MKDFETVSKLFRWVVVFLVMNLGKGIIYSPVWLINMKCQWAEVLVCVELVVYEM